MNPHKMNKVDISKLSEQEQKAFKLYGKLPTKALHNIQKQNERKYFDSGDYMMSKAGVSPSQPLGTAIPTPEGVPHASPPSNGQLASSPTSSASFSFGDGMNSENQNALNRRASLAPVGVGMQAPNSPVAIPGSHQRRCSESQSRLSPPGGIQVPPSSYPIQHGSYGSSPVKTSGLAHRADQEMEV